MVLSLRFDKSKKKKEAAPTNDDDGQQGEAAGAAAAAPMTSSTTTTSTSSSSSSPPSSSPQQSQTLAQPTLPTSPSAPNNNMFGSGSNLAQYYIPDKIAASPSHWGSEARRASRVATGGWGAAASTSRSSRRASLTPAEGVLLPSAPLKTTSGRSSPLLSSSSANRRGSGNVLFRPLYRNSADYSTEGLPTTASSTTAASALTSSIYSPYNGKPHDSSYASSIAQRPSAKGHRNRKVPAGRQAWGENGGGSPALGAGEYEDDDGIELSSSHERLGGGRPASSSAEGIETPPLSSSTTTSNHNHHNDRGSTSRLLPAGRGNSSSNSSTVLVGGSTSFTAKKRRFRWNRFKWFMVAANALLTIYSIAGFVAVTVALTGMYRETAILDVVNQVEMTLCLVAMCLCLCTVLFGWAGLLLNNRAFLSVYTLLLWVSFAFIVAPGYIAYKRRTFNLSEAAADSIRCFSRSLLPGCKGLLLDFERRALQYIYIASFSIVPAHLLIIVTSLLCSDHITYRFGKGVTPKEYRVDDGIISQQQALMTRPQSPQTVSAANGQSTVLLSVPRPPFWSSDGKRMSTGSSKSSNFLF